MAAIDDLLEDYARKLHKALDHLAYSHQKVSLLSTSPQDLDEETLETWESYTARFARVVDLFATKYLRTLLVRDDPAFEGSLRDTLDLAEKRGLVSDAARWVAFRKLRNATAHEYEEADIAAFLRRIREAGAEVLAIRGVLGAR